jgi:UDP-N-acetylmuramoyl-tripeptide--D-alanyl-D-alanine ligase
MFRTTFIAITGSVGKTTSKEALAAILGSRFRIVKTEVSRNELMQVASLILSVRPWHRYAVLEVATDGPGWMKRMAWLARPHIAVILRVARTHFHRFRSLEATAAEKAELLKTVRRNGIVILNADDPLVAAMAARTCRRVAWFGSTAECDFRMEQVHCEFPDPLRFRVCYQGESAEFEVPLVGEHWAPSLTAAVAAARLCGVGLGDSAALLRNLQPVQGRMQPLVTRSGAVILRDDENGSIATFDDAFAALGKARARRKLVVFGEVADDDRKDRRRAARLGEAAAKIADAVICVGGHAAFGAAGAVRAGMDPAHAHGFLTMREAADYLRGELRQGDLVLIKGRDHIGRVGLAQAGEVKCWAEDCRRRLECDDCPELWTEGRAPAPARLVQIVSSL